VSYSTASEANDVYEGFLFSLVVATARKSGAAVHYEDVTGSKTHSLVFRTSPGRLWSARHNYTYAVVEFGTACGEGEKTLAPRQNRAQGSSRIPEVGPRAAAVPSAQRERPQPSSAPGWPCHRRS